MNKSVNDAVISSRIRLARNIAGLVFPHKLDSETAFSFIKKIYDVLQKTDSFKMYVIGQLDDVEKRAFVEKHLISLDLTKNDRIGAVLVNSDESLSVMLNEEDHIREQSIVKSFDLEKAYKKIRKVDDAIINNISLAYDDNLGFLTSCPTNVGTGMRASVMLFLPALTRSGLMPALIKTLDEVKMAVRGIYGEGSQSTGYIYQVSNKVSLGYSEEEIISNVSKAVVRLCDLEEQERNKLFSQNKIGWTDKIMRSKGVLTNAYVLSTNEFFERFADVKVGVALGLIGCSDMIKLNDFLTDMLPANLMLKKGSVINETQRDILRASFARENLNKILDC